MLDECCHLDQFNHSHNTKETKKCCNHCQMWEKRGDISGYVYMESQVWFCGFKRERRKSPARVGEVMFVVSVVKVGQDQVDKVSPEKMVAK